MKLLLSQSSGGWSTPTDSQAKQLNLPYLQLYNLTNDINESNNLYQKNGPYQDFIDCLILKLNQYIENGRSTNGIKQKMIDKILLFYHQLYHYQNHVNIHCFRLIMERFGINKK